MHPASGLAATAVLIASTTALCQTPTYQALMQDDVIAADIWDAVPRILSANFGFDGIVGVPINEDDVRAAGGTWMDLPDDIEDTAPLGAFTSAAAPPAVATAFGFATDHADAMPIVFSWPVLPSTVQPTDFEIRLNDGTTVTPEVASIFPCHEFNERNVVVIAGEIANRIPPGEPGARFVTSVAIVDDGSPLTLLGPGGIERSAVGMSRPSGNPYLAGGGPTLVGAKLSRASAAGEGAPVAFNGQFPNDGSVLYGDEAEYRLRVLTTGGFSPNGVSAVLPTEFERYFRLHVEGESETRLLTQTGVDYSLSGGRLRILGLSDLGLPGQPLDLAYQEDGDNYIDIILTGDEAAMRQIRAVEIPAAGNYDPFFNPGGPGNDPTPGVRYTQPGPRDLEPVQIALDEPMTTTFDPANTPCNAADIADPRGTLDGADVNAFIDAFGSREPEADVAMPYGVLDGADVSMFISAFGAGCP